MKNLILNFIILICLTMCYQKVVAQATIANNNNGIPDFLGGNAASAKPLDIGQSNALAINFYTNGGAYPFAPATQRMTILGPTGWVGIGNAFTPGFRLDVWDDINIAPQAANFINNGYRIGGNLVLYIPGDNLGWNNTFVGRSGNIAAAPGTNNTYLGFEAGLASAVLSRQNVLAGVRAGRANTATGSTFIGYEAGIVNTNGDFNTAVGCSTAYNNTLGGLNSFFGKEAGFSNTTAHRNTFLGTFSGRTNSIGERNTFVGFNAGFANLDGDNNTFVGNHSGEDNINADQNSFFGDFSGNNTVDGSFNTFIGAGTGATNTFGTFNTCLGYFANVDQDNLINTSAIGHNARVMSDDQMILGGTYTDAGGNLHTVNVGIGLSGILPGPGALNPLTPPAPTLPSLLEINAINFSNPPSTNDIDDMLTNGCTATSTGYSGLRFRDLTAKSWPCDPNSLALSVDQDGDVILVPERPGFGLCSAGPTILTGNAGLNMNNFNVYFDGQPTFDVAGNVINSVNIGVACNTAPVAKFNVFRNSTYVATPPNNPAGLYVGNYDQGAVGSPFGTAWGVMGDVTTITSNNAIGGNFTSSGAGTGDNIGVRGYAARASRRNIGVYGIVSPPFPGGLSYGVYGIVNTTPGSTEYAVFGDLGPTVIPCPAGPPVPPCVATAPDYAGYFNGDVGSTTGFWVTSDASLKTNIEPLEDPMLVINQLNPKTYYYDQVQNTSMILPSDIHYGLLAQDVYNVLPQLTKDCIHPPRYDSLGNQTHAEINFKALNYTEIIPFLIAAIQEQQAQIEALQGPQQIANPNGNNNGNSIDVVLASKSIVLNQNVPNPFKEQTTIEYFIPDDAEQVKIIFTDNKGSVLKEVEITEKGKGQLNVYAADLSSGIYSYTIVANGVTIDTKQMMKSK